MPQQFLHRADVVTRFQFAISPYTPLIRVNTTVVA